MGGIPTNVDGQAVIDADNTVCCRACTPPAKLRLRSRCVAPTASAPTRCSTSSFGRRGSRTSPASWNSVGMPELARRRERDVADRIEKLKNATGGENCGGATIQDGMT